MKKLLVQTGILLLVYYVVPGIITDFLSDLNPQISRYSILFIKIAVLVLIVYTWMDLKTKIESEFSEILKTRLKIKMEDETRRNLTKYLLLLVFVLLIVLLGIPLLKDFQISSKILTVIKLGVLAYFIYMAWTIYKLFDQEETPTKAS